MTACLHAWLMWNDKSSLPGLIKWKNDYCLNILYSGWLCITSRPAFCIQEMFDFNTNIASWFYWSHFKHQSPNSSYGELCSPSKCLTTQLWTERPHVWIPPVATQVDISPPSPGGNGQLWENKYQTWCLGLHTCMYWFSVRAKGQSCAAFHYTLQF